MRLRTCRSRVRPPGRRNAGGGPSLPSVLLLADATSDATLVLAIITGILALATVVLAVVTHIGNRGARADAATQLSASYRPVIVPFQRAGQGVTYRGGQVPAGSGPYISENPPGRPDLPRFSAASIAVENVGTGAVLNVRGTFRAPRGSGVARFPTEGLAAGARGVVMFESWTGQSLGYTGNDPAVCAEVLYDDVAGKTYRTELTFDVGNNAYEFKLA